MKTAHFINGSWLESTDTFNSICPEDQTVIGSVAVGSHKEVSLAVEAAKKALPTWSSLPVLNRAQYIRKASEILAGRYGATGKATPLKDLICREMGKRLPEADIEVMESCDILSFFADQAQSSLADRPITLNRELWPTKKSIISFTPVGVVGIIKPWNYPLELPLWAIGAALAAGNTVVFKPSEYTPFVAAEIMSIFEEAKLPPGVLNMVTGDGVAGAALVDHPDVDMISFTGSRPVGAEVAQKCAQRSCRVSLELGGKDAMIVLSDADLELAVNGAVWGSFTNAGQVCVGVKRLLIADSIYNDFRDRFVSLVGQLKVGRDIGPLVSAEQLAKVEHHIHDAVQLGAKILVGGHRLDSRAFEKGLFFSPTVLEDTSHEMLIEQEDTFGPVVYLKRFSAVDEVIEMVHSVPYDLGASVWTTDPQLGLQIARRLRTGMVWVNDVNVAFPQAPWCGHKWSGHGIELSEFSFQEYSSLKHINCELGGETRRAWWFPYL